METSKIGIFESISLLSKLMPYYGSSHEGFLLLSLLSKSIRNYLLEHYPKYRTFMLKYAQKIEYVRDKHLAMKLPLDLFQFSYLNVYSEEDAEFLVGLIHNLTNKEGIYFGEHYMSDQICFEKIFVCPEYISTLHPHIESLSSIKVFSFEGQDLSLQHSFRDLIVLDDIFKYGAKLKTCFFIDSELKEINPIYDSFKRIKEVGCDSYNIASEKLNTLKQASIQEIENIRFGEINVENFEQITNQLLNYKIHTLVYSYFNCESISNLALENISKINPQKLHLPRLRSILNDFRIFLHIREDINVSFGFVDEQDHLKFEKAFVIFKTKDDMMKAHCDKIGFYFDENLSQENILFLENYICISNFKDIAIGNFKKENATNKTPLEGLSLDDLKNENCILISRNNLSCLKLNLEDISYIFENEINVTNFKSLSLKTKIVIELFSMDDLAELNKLKEYFPEHSELEINHYNEIDKTNFDETLLLSILSKFRLTSLVVHYGSKEENIFKVLLQMASIQETLEHFCIGDLYISKCTSVIELLIELKRIKTIEMVCHYNNYDDDEELEEWKQEIKQFKKEFRKKHLETAISTDYQER